MADPGFDLDFVNGVGVGVGVGAWTLIESVESGSKRRF